jgi:transmembrane sensor
MNPGNDDTEASAENRLKREAADWVTKQDQGFTPEEQDAFFHWLAQDPRHREIFSQRKSMWKKLDVLAEWRPEHSLEPNPDLLAVQARSALIKWVGLCAAMAAVFTIGLLVKAPRSDRPVDAAIMLTPVEGALHYENHILPDGSVIELNRGAQVSVSFTDHLLLVNLSDGEAHFTVTKDSRRPFVVQARNTTVKAVGTAFNVSIGSEEIAVLVTEGKVLMTVGLSTRGEMAQDFNATAGQELSAGQGSSLSRQSTGAVPVIERFTAEEISRRLSWKSEVLEFTATPLAEVILEFNRRNHTQLVIEDPALGSREITATLRPNNLNGFIELLELTLDVQAESAGDFKIILHRESK